MQQLKSLSRGALCAAFAGCVIASAHADSTTLLSGPPPSWFGYSSSHDTWNGVMLVSGIVALIGLVDNDSTLVIIGGAGVLLSLYEESSSRFAFGGYRHADLMKSGPWTMGLKTTPGIALAPGLASPQPSAFVQYTVRF